MSVRRLVLLLGDQLDPQISSLRDADPARDRILLVEAVEEGEDEHEAEAEGTPS